MPHIVEVDQSNKVEDSGDTFLAFSDGISWAIQVPFSVKQAGLQALRSKGKPKARATLMVFAACVFLLLENHLGQMDRVIVDNEYDGQGDDIKAFLLRHIWKRESRFEPWRIEVASIGKGSSAHNRAWSARKGKGAINRTITTQELLELVG